LPGFEFQDDGLENHPSHFPVPYPRGVDQHDKAGADESERGYACDDCNHGVRPFSKTMTHPCAIGAGAFIGLKMPVRSLRHDILTFTTDRQQSVDSRPRV